MICDEQPGWLVREFPSHIWWHQARGFCSLDGPIYTQMQCWRAPKLPGFGFEKDLGNFGKFPKSTTWSFFPYESERSKKMKVHPSFSDKPFNFGQAKYQVLTAKRATQKGWTARHLWPAPLGADGETNLPHFPQSQSTIYHALYTDPILL